jgi:ribosomal protein S18 acetylase RimI-like enzyme
MMEIRQARADDKGPLADIMYPAGRELYDFAFNLGDLTALDYIRFEYHAGGGFCGHRNLTVAFEENHVVGTVGLYDRQSYGRLSRGAMGNVFRFYGWVKAWTILRRMSHVGSIVSKPDPGELYLSNLGVHRARRSRGIGSALIELKRQEARARGYRKLALDVAETNPRATKLYRRIGFEVTGKKVFTGARTGFPEYNKMELPL